MAAADDLRAENREPCGGAASGPWGAIEEHFHRLRGLAAGAREMALNDLAHAEPATAKAVRRLLDHYLPEFLEPPRRPMQLEPGDKVGPYTILDRVGVGGMGVVYRAEMREPVRRTVAMKLVQDPASRSLVRRFWVEQQALHTLDHPNVLRLLDSAVTHDGLPYFCTEFLDGDDILTHSERENAPLQQRLEWFYDLCEAVQHAHAGGVVHRDIKAANVVMSQLNGEWAPKLVDFGVARLVDQDGVRLTDHGQIVGTRRTMSPEQREGAEASPSTDVYALGLLLTELLHGVSCTDKQRARLDECVALATADQASDRLQAVVDLQERLGGLAGVAAGAAKDAKASVAESGLARRGATGSRGARGRRDRTVRRWVIALALLLLLVTGGKKVCEWRLLADEKLLLSAPETMAQLWPLGPDSVAEIKEWLARHDAPRGRLAWYRKLVRVAPDMAAALTRIEAFYDDPIQAQDQQWSSARQTVAAALEVALRLEREHARPAYAESWRAVQQSLRGDSRFAGVAVSPVHGLVPLLQDDSSGLWHFWHVPSGARPQRSADGGDWDVTPDTGLVFALVPGGEFLFGEAAAYGAEFVPGASGPVVTSVTAANGLRVGDILLQSRRMHLRHVAVVERGSRRLSLSLPLPDVRHRPGVPLLTCQVESHFVALHEVNRAQTVRAGFRPQTAGGIRQLDPDVIECFPVSSLSIANAVELTRRWGVQIPTEFEWEWAATAGGSQLQPPGGNSRGAADGWRGRAPVGHFPPNRWRLHDITGNAVEIVLSMIRDRAAEFHWRGGYHRLTLAQSHVRSVRGGAKLRDASFFGCRPVLRWPAAVTPGD